MQALKGQGVFSDSGGRRKECTSGLGLQGFLEVRPGSSVREGGAHWKAPEADGFVKGGRH